MQKELLESNQYGLVLCEYSKKYPDCKVLSENLLQIQKVLNKISGTAKRKNPILYLPGFFIL